MNIIAQRGKTIFLLDTGDGKGVVLRVDTYPPQMSQPKLIDAHLKFGGWMPFEGDPAPVMQAASDAQVIEKTIDKATVRALEHGWEDRVTIPHGSDTIES